MRGSDKDVERFRANCPWSTGTDEDYSLVMDWMFETREARESGMPSLHEFSYSYLNKVARQSEGFVVDYN